MLSSQVQKVRKTANEYYLVAAGLPDPHMLPTAEDRAQGIASFGFAMIGAMNVLNVDLRNMGIKFSLQVESSAEDNRICRKHCLSVFPACAC